MANILDEYENKTNLLFKQFQGKAQANIATLGSSGAGGPTGFQNEPIKGLNMVFQENILSQSFPTQLPPTQTVTALFSTVTDSSWVTNIWDQSMSSQQIVDSLGNPLPLRFYKRLYLNPVLNGKSQAWWLLDASNVDSIPENNVLKYTIPFGYDGASVSTFRPIVEYWNGSSWQDDQQGDKDSLNWIMDPATGILQFYQTESKLNSMNIGDSPLAITDPTKRPRISFIKYTGNFGTGASSGGGGGGSGQLGVGVLDSSSGPQPTQDVSAIYFENDNFDVSFVNNTARISFIGAGSANVSDLSYYFFDVPNDLSGVGDVSMGSTGPFIELFINKIPLQTKSAVPFGNSLQYPGGTSNAGDQVSLPINYLPFFDELKIQYKDWNDGLHFTNGWFDLSINNTFPYVQSFIPPTINKVNLGTGSVNGVELLDKSNNTNNHNPPFVTYNNDTQLKIGGRYQFRLFLTNNGEEPGIIDPVYKIPVPYNYLYIPDGSGRALPLGEFGFATSPTVISFSSAQLTSFSIIGSNNDPSGADTSLNIPFPINSGLGYKVFFGFDISQTPLPAATGFSGVEAKQMPSYRNSIPTFGFQYETPTGQLTKTMGPVTNSNVFMSLVYPETNYHITNFYMRNDSVDNSNVKAFAKDSSYVVLPYDPSYTTGIPTRAQAGAAQNRLQSASNLTFTEDSGITTTQAIPISGGSAQDVFFLNKPYSTSFTVGNLPGKFANNKNTIDDLSHVGYDSDTIGLTIIGMQTRDNPTTIRYDASTNFTRGYLRTTNVGISNGDTNFFELNATASEGGGVPALQKKGYYTDITINNAKLLDVSLSTYPDICNNSYTPYTVAIIDNFNQNNTFIKGNEVTGEIAIGEKPGNMIYLLNTYSNPTMSISAEFFGLKMPERRTNQPVANISYQYDLLNISEWWRPNTTNITRAELEYNNFANNLLIDSNDAAWPSSALVPNILVNPNLVLNSNLWANANGSGIPNSRKYSRDIADIGFTGSQFRIETKWNDNVTYWSSDYTNSEFQDISFGTPGKYLWWDTTWSINNVTQHGPGEMPYGFLNLSPTSTAHFKTLLINSAPNPALSDFDHGVSLVGVNNQAIWANDAFRGPATTGKNNPYIDYASNFYNPGGALKDYSGLANQGYTVSATMSSNQFWANNTTTSVSLTPVKFFTIEVVVPNTSSTAYQNYSLYVENESGSEVKPYDPTGATGDTDGFVLYQNEIVNDSSTGTSTLYPSASQNRSYNGLIVWTSSALTSPGSFNGTKNVSGVPSDIKWKIVFSSTSSSLTTILQLSIGIPSSQNIKSINLTFLT